MSVGLRGGCKLGGSDGILKYRTESAWGSGKKAGYSGRGRQFPGSLPASLPYASFADVSCPRPYLGLRGGATLSQATESVARAFGLQLRILPVSDQRISTMVEVSGATLSFQEYFVKRKTEDEVRAIRFEGMEHAEPAPGVIEAIHGFFRRPAHTKRAA